MKKILSVVGARPNFMKVAPIYRALLKYSYIIDHKIVHTGQHYDVQMSDTFFKDLEMPQPAYFLGVGSGTHAEQTARIMVEFEKVCNETKPDLVIVVGDVNSTLACSVTAVKLGIQVAHIEGGLRSFDRTMPEEINRLVTDSVCNYCFVTEESAVTNLTKEGFPKDKIFFVGNTMIDSQIYALDKAKSSKVLMSFDLKPSEYTLITLHRPSNVDSFENLKDLLHIFRDLSEHRKIVFPVHPRTRKNLQNFGLCDDFSKIENLLLLEPLGYIDFLSLMLNSDFVFTDSGGIQEETTALGIPCITIRTTTERPVTVDIGTNILIKPELYEINMAIHNMLNGTRKKGTVPPYWDGKASERIVKIIKEDIFGII